MHFRKKPENETQPEGEKKEGLIKRTRRRITQVIADPNEWPYSREGLKALAAFVLGETFNLDFASVVQTYVVMDTIHKGFKVGKTPEFDKADLMKKTAKLGWQGTKGLLWLIGVEASVNTQVLDIIGAIGERFGTSTIQGTVDVLKGLPIVPKVAITVLISALKYKELKKLGEKAKQDRKDQQNEVDKKGLQGQINRLKSKIQQTKGGDEQQAENDKYAPL